MKLAELKQALQKHPDAHVRFVLPNGEPIPAHAHVTEVARLDKRFIDCGGTFRTDSFCRLQTWVADDTSHRLTAGKLFKILEMARSVLQSDDLEVDVEHEAGYISQFPLQSISATPEAVTFQLATRHTACLALDKCLPPAPPLWDQNPLKFNFRAEPAPAGCCGGKK